MYWLPPSRVKQSGKATTMRSSPISRVEPFRQVLAEADPGRVGQAAAGEAALHAVRDRANKQPSDENTCG